MRSNSMVTFMKKPLVFLLLGVGISHAGIDQVLASLQYTFSKGADPQVVLGIAAACLFVVGILVLNEIRKADARERARAKISWEAFYAKAAALKLSELEIKQLEALVIEARVVNADSLITSAQVFENSRETYYDSRGGVNAMNDEELQAFHTIRQRLGFSPLPIETPFTSTRQFLSGLRVVLEFPELNVASTTQIEEVDERRWITANPFREKLAFHVGMKARLSLTRGGDAEYGIDTELEEARDHSLIFRHTRKLSRKQLRNWVRVDVNIPATAQYIPSDPALPQNPVPVKGRVVDLSGGGLALRLPMQLPVGSRLLVDFPVNGTNISGIDVEVIRVSPLKMGQDELFQHSVSFKDIQKPLQEKIVRFVFEKQRQEAQWR